MNDLLFDNKQNVSLADYIIKYNPPILYAFYTAMVPFAVKVGDTYRGILVRLNEWRKYFPDLEEIFHISAEVAKGVFVRDYGFMAYAEVERGIQRLKKGDFPSGVHTSTEFYRVVKEQIKSILEDFIEDAKADYLSDNRKYAYYTYEDSPVKCTLVKRKKGNKVYTHAYTYSLRPNQQDVVNNFLKAISKGRTDLLFAAFCRFGKSLTALDCTRAINAKSILIISGKDVKNEWEDNVGKYKQFEDYVFINSARLKNNPHLIDETIASGKVAVVYLTFQDIKGGTIKPQHVGVFPIHWDVILVDETHYYARAKSVNGLFSNDSSYGPTTEERNLIKTLKYKVRIDMSGTPYRILAKGQYSKEDIIGFYSYEDMFNAMIEYDTNHCLEDGYNPNKNPYRGFPTLLKLAIELNDSSASQIKTHEIEGGLAALSELYRTIGKGKKARFIHEKEVLDRWMTIDGCRKDKNSFSLMDNEAFTAENCRVLDHILVRLPSCNAVNALDNLIEAHKNEFIHLNEYFRILITGDTKTKSVESVKSIISSHANKGEKTISFTVDKMLTGSTVEQWSTFFDMSDCKSVESYVQANSRILTPWIKKAKENGEDCKTNDYDSNYKPMALLVDWCPDRMFDMIFSQAEYMVKNNLSKKSKEEIIKNSLECSKLIYVKAHKLIEMKCTDVINKVDEFRANRNIKDSVLDIPFDSNCIEDETFRKELWNLANLGQSHNKLVIKANENITEKTDADISTDTYYYNSNNSDIGVTPNKKAKKVITDREKLYDFYTLVIIYSYLTKSNVTSIDDIYNSIFDKKNLYFKENQRIIKNIGLNKILIDRYYKINNGYAKSVFDDKIREMNRTKNLPLQESTLFKKFNKMNESTVISPDFVCDTMCNSVINSKEDLSDNRFFLFDTVGEFAMALCKKLNSYGIENKDIHILTIPKMNLCKEFLRKTYETLGLDINDIASFTLEDAVDEFEDIDVFTEKFSKFNTKKYFSNVTLDDIKNYKGSKKMKFDAVIGNPPYQGQKSNGAYQSCYHKYWDLGKSVSDKMSLIIPQRFLNGAGSLPKDWMNSWKKDPNSAAIKKWVNSKDVFGETVNIMGGVCVCLYDKGKTFEDKGDLLPEVKSIFDKVKSKDNLEENLTSIGSLQTKFVLSELYKDFPELKDMISSEGKERRMVSKCLSYPCFSDIKKGRAKIHGIINNKRTYKYIKTKYMDSSHKAFGYRSVCIPKGNGSKPVGSGVATSVIGKPFIKRENEGYTQSFIGIGWFKTDEEVDNCLKYIKSKFCRVLIGINKSTQNNRLETMRFVPLQDFTSNSDIDWSKSIHEIDLQLYAKYGLSQKEIDFIEKNIKEMV